VKEMKSKQKNNQNEKGADMNPKRNPTGGRKHKRGGQQKVEYLKYTFDAPLIGG
jgi:hypothetical protein